MVMIQKLSIILGILLCSALYGLPEDIKLAVKTIKSPQSYNKVYDYIANVATHDDLRELYRLLADSPYRKPCQGQDISFVLDVLAVAMVMTGFTLVSKELLTRYPTCPASIAVGGLALGVGGFLYHQFFSYITQPQKQDALPTHRKIILGFLETWFDSPKTASTALAKK
jgi:hypothetical protein